MDSRNLSKPQQDLLALVTQFVDECDTRYHRDFRTVCDRLYAVYADVKGLRGDYNTVDRKDRDTVAEEATSRYGKHLWIPYVFGVIENTIPSVIAQDPTVRFMPCDEEAMQNERNLAQLIQIQMAKMRYTLGLQNAAKKALIYGISWRKHAWRTQKRDQKQIQRGAGDKPWIVETVPGHVKYDDPYSFTPDVRDVFWDPNALALDEIQKMGHRVWRDTKYVMEMFKNDVWGDLGDAGKIELTEEDVAATNSASGWSEVHGHGGKQSPKDGIHEIIEYHDGDRVITILNRVFPVRVIKNPSWCGSLPFTAVRPVDNPDAIAGIPATLVLEDLQEELMELRTQRRDNAHLVLQKPFVYQNGAVTKKNIAFGRRTAFGVNGRPDDVIKELQVGDIPYSSYKEEEALKDDMQFLGGALDPTSGGGAVAATATGAQLVYQQGSRRIEAMTRRIEREAVSDEIAMYAEMNQQHITERSLIVPDAMEPGVYEPKWKKLNIDAERLRGNYLPTPVPNSMAAENVPQMRQDVSLWMPFLQDPNARKDKVFEKILTLLGERNPEAFVQRDDMMPASMLAEFAHVAESVGAELGIDQNAMAQALGHAAQQVQQMAAETQGAPQQAVAEPAV